MNYSKPIKFLIISLVLLTLFVPNSSSESYELGKEVLEIEEDYYLPMDMDGLDFNYEMLITSNYEIDIVVLTDSEFDYCCSNDEASSISFTDTRSMSFTKEGSIIVPELEDGYLLIFG